MLSFLERHRALGFDGGAANWTRLADRMRYIIDLFRSRQQYAPLQDQPFTLEQRRQIAAGLPVTGRL